MTHIIFWICHILIGNKLSLDDLVFDAEAKVAAPGDKDPDIGIAARILKYIYDFVRPTTGEVIIESIKYILQVYQEAKKKGLRIRMVPKRWIPHFNLPRGHPRDGVLYIAHP